MENNNTNSNPNGFDGRRGYATSPRQAYGYPPPAASPVAAGYPRPHPVVGVPLSSSSAPAPMYNMQQQYQASGHPIYANMPSPAPVLQAQQPRYSQYSQQGPPLQGQQYASSQPQMRMHQQPQQPMHPQSLQAYQLDGSAQSHPSPAMRQSSQGNAYMNQQQPRQQQTVNQTTPSRPQSQPKAQPQVLIPSRTPSQSQSQSQPQSRPYPQVQIHNRTPSQPQSQVRSSSQVHPQTRTPSQSQPRVKSSPQMQAQPRTPSQPQSQVRPSSQPHPLPQQRSTSHGQIAQVVIERPRPQPQSRTSAATSHSAAATPSRDPPVDYQVLLLGLADQYISKAHGMSGHMARNTYLSNVDEYFKLISAGLSCMESVLKNWKFPDPRVEARLQLRYANLLFEETENETELEDLLTKGIALCERSRLTDMKYSMKCLQIRAHHRTKASAAYRMIDQMVEMTESYRQFAWTYVFQFLRVSLMLQARYCDTAAVLQQLRRIIALAESQRQAPILAMSAALEALVHLRSGGVDSVELAQRALAAARTHQLDPAVTGIPQLQALLDCLDLCCDLIDTKPEQQAKKMKAMQKTMDDGRRSAAWSSDGSFCLPVREPAPEDISQDTGGIMERTAQGQRAITFQWIRRSELFALGYIFSCLASANKNVVDRKAEKYASEGAKVTKDDFNPDNERKVQSLKSVSSHLDRRAFYHQMTLQQLAFLKCDRSDWEGAIEVIVKLNEGIDILAADRDDLIQITTLFLMGIAKQGVGELRGALAHLRAPALSLSAGHRGSSAIQDLRILAALNVILILRPRPERRSEVDRLMALVEPLCSGHANGSFQSAFNIIRASSTANLPIIKMKNFLSESANIARKQSNQQLLCMTINLMTSTFFVDIVGEKAESSAKVGKMLAERTQSPLWEAVANQLLANTLDFGGKREEVGQARIDASEAMLSVPQLVREQFETR